MSGNRGVRTIDLKHYVYRFLDSQGAPLYIGCTYDLANRLTQHAQQREWFAEVAHIEADIYPDRASALAAERAAIKQHNPPHNVTYKVRDKERKPRKCGYCARGRCEGCNGLTHNYTPCTCDKHEAVSA